MTHPIDIIANAIRVADGNHSLGAGQLAQVVADTLTDERIVECAMEALNGMGFITGSGPDDITFDDARTLALAVLRSVAEPA